MLVSMGFKPNYITRAFKVYEVKFIVFSSQLFEQKKTKKKNTQNNINKIHTEKLWAQL